MEREAQSGPFRFQYVLYRAICCIPCNYFPVDVSWGQMVPSLLWCTMEATWVISEQSWDWTVCRVLAIKLDPRDEEDLVHCYQRLPIHPWLWYCPPNCASLQLWETPSVGISSHPYHVFPSSIHAVHSCHSLILEPSSTLPTMFIHCVCLCLAPSQSQFQFCLSQWHAFFFCRDWHFQLGFQTRFPVWYSCYHVSCKRKIAEQNVFFSINCKRL